MVATVATQSDPISINIVNSPHQKTLISRLFFVDKGGIINHTDFVRRNVYYYLKTQR